MEVRADPRGDYSMVHVHESEPWLSRLGRFVTHRQKPYHDIYSERDILVSSDTNWRRDDSARSRIFGSSSWLTVNPIQQQKQRYVKTKEKNRFPVRCVTRAQTDILLVARRLPAL